MTNQFEAGAAMTNEPNASKNGKREAVNFSISVRLNLSDLRLLSPDQLRATMQGLAAVIQAEGNL